MGQINDTFRADDFCGDFDSLPIRAHILYGAVPTHPTSDDFQEAAMRAENENDAAADWHLEAVRYRRHSPGALLTDEALRTIAQATSARLYKKCTA